VFVDLQVTLAGACVGLVVGLTGMGGGALMTPLLVLGFGVDPLAAVSSDLLASLAMKPVGAAVHLRRGTVHGGVVGLLCLGSVPAAFLGAWLLNRAGPGALLREHLVTLLGGALLVAATGVLIRSALDLRRKGEDREGPLRLRPLATLAVGAGGGLLVGLTSVGSGSLMVACLMLLYPRLRAAPLVGTDLLQAIPLVASATLGHLLFGRVELALTGSVLLGALPAVYLGARLSSASSRQMLRPLILITLLACALQLLGVPKAWTAGAVLATAALALLAWRLLPLLTLAAASGSPGPATDPGGTPPG